MVNDQEGMMPKPIMSQLVTRLQKERGRRAQKYSPSPPSTYEQLCAGIRAWEEAAWPEAISHEPTAEERKPAKVAAFLQIRRALRRMGPTVRDHLRSATRDDEGGILTLALVFKVKEKDVGTELPVPRRLEYDPIYTPVDQWICGKLREAVAEILNADVADTSPRAPAICSITSSTQDDNDDGGAKLTFYPGGFSYRGVRQRLSGKPLQILEALNAARDKTLPLRALQERIWDDREAGQETIRSAVATARKVLRAAIKQAGGDDRIDPLPVVDRGSDRTAWHLSLP
jgi:hypothetical protein